MKKLLFIMAGMVILTGQVMAAPSPTPSVAPSPTPVPEVIPANEVDHVDVALTYNLSSSAVTDDSLTNLRTGQTWSTPSSHRLYITDIFWSLQSSVSAFIEWDGTYADVLFNRMYAPSTGQGSVLNLQTPITSLDPGMNPVVTTDKASTGFLYIGGYLE